MQLLTANSNLWNEIITLARQLIKEQLHHRCGISPEFEQNHKIICKVQNKLILYMRNNQISFSNRQTYDTLYRTVTEIVYYSADKRWRYKQNNNIINNIDQTGFDLFITDNKNIQDDSTSYPLDTIFQE
ncbi:Hypothetical_protein [Hexamita inflata]|uniref:Hypothetical_protein n=1 Tax=Hexamita inflata TaxID=28002 RepID=A0AA86TZM7_9EUKA|nr:Hypothetical protein HINF_LOCUS20529 [Hexamita inflata]CAI9934556.1 Hypothetical protein HINF_LOCUS22201 [Hexamita inflata]